MQWTPFFLVLSVAAPVGAQQGAALVAPEKQQGAALVAPQKEEAKSEPASAVEPLQVTDEALSKAWEALSEPKKREASEWFQSEARHLPSYQNTLIAYLRSGLDKDPYDWPEAVATRMFDPAVHTPAQVIPRLPLSFDSKRYQTEWERIMGWRPARKLQSAFRYDYGARTIIRTGDPQDPERLFQNGVAGFVPDLDLGEALVAMHLDDGALIEVHQAFGHTYAVRTGEAFPGITLYDAWTCGRKIEMPDVECLGIVHTLGNDWKTWVAPVTKQKSLYAKIEEWYVPMHRARSLQTALARTYLSASPTLRDGYQGTERYLHSLWELSKSTPEDLQTELPTSKRWEKWMEAGQKKLRKDKKLADSADNRIQHLRYGEHQVRQLWIRVLRGMGTLADPGK